QGSSFTTVFPIVWAARNDVAGSQWKLIFPLYFSRTRDHGRYHQWLTPIGGGTRNDDATSRSLTFLVPPLFWRRDKDHEFESYLLLYWRYRDLVGGASTTVLFPYFSFDDTSGSTRVGFPLFWYFRDNIKDATAHSLFPIYFHRKNPDESTTAAGLFPFWAYYRRFGDGWSTGLTPLAFFGSRGGKTHAVIPPLLFFHFGDQRTSTSSTLSVPLFYRFADKHSSNLGVLPLLYFQGHDHEDSYHVQFPFFWRLHDGERNTTTTVIPRASTARAPTAGRPGWPRCCSPAAAGPGATSCSSRCSGTWPTTPRTAAPPSSPRTCTGGWAARPPTRSSRSCTGGAAPSRA